MLIALLFALTLSPVCDEEFAMLAGGTAARTEGRLVEATRQFEAASTCHPESINALLELAVTLSWQQRLDEAIATFEEALERDPSNRGALLGQARVLVWAGRFDRAQQVYRMLAGADPNDVEVLNGMALIHRSRWRLGRARTLYRQVLEVSPGNAEATEALRMLEGVRRYRIDASLGGTIVDDGRRVAGSRLSVSLLQGSRTTLTLGVSSSVQALTERIGGAHAMSAGISRRVGDSWTTNVGYRLSALNGSSRQTVSAGVSKRLGRLSVSTRLQAGTAGEIRDALASIGAVVDVGQGRYALLQVYLSGRSDGYRSQAVVIGGRFPLGPLGISPNATRFSDPGTSRWDAGMGIDARIWRGLRAGLQSTWSEGSGLQHGLRLSVQ